MAGKNVLELNDSNWNTEVLQSPVPVVVDFWATWCGPCRMIAPTIEALADQYAGRVKVGKVDVDANQDLASRYRVMSIPQVCVFKNGQEVARIVGAQPKKVYEDAIEKALS
ncbi:MAG: thioredoxin [Gemmatales bacterium]|nr:thioredoxin [Gemmatales bacterium]MCS7160544.1 thioredoxin [Gemmatales bacterium]MDW8175745.1 thioredoxin [Gemmatales bacterium]MDW8222204.1 thioredoxin [Gemmatales bacterium]